MKKIAILYICVNHYNVFWKDFFITSEKFFLNGVDELGNKKIEKHYFVFSDIPKENIYIPSNKSNNINIIKVENLDWINNVLKKYEDFLKIKSTLEEFDFIFAFNANCLFIQNITEEEFLPNLKNGENFTAVWDPNIYRNKKEDYPHEENLKSSAYIEPEKRREEYFISAIMGGVGKQYIEACDIMSKNTKIDSQNNIVAIYHDQSHWNKFLSNRDDVKVLQPSYAYPETQKMSFEKKLILRDKSSMSLFFWFNKIRHWPIHKRILISTKYIIGFYIKKFFRLFNIYID